MNTLTFSRKSRKQGMMQVPASIASTVSAWKLSKEKLTPSRNPKLPSSRVPSSKGSFLKLDNCKTSSTKSSMLQTRNTFLSKDSVGKRTFIAKNVTQTASTAKTVRVSAQRDKSSKHSVASKKATSSRAAFTLDNFS